MGRYFIVLWCLCICGCAGLGDGSKSSGGVTEVKNDLSAIQDTAKDISKTSKEAATVSKAQAIYTAAKNAEKSVEDLADMSKDLVKANKDVVNLKAQVKDRDNKFLSGIVVLGFVVLAVGVALFIYLRNMIGVSIAFGGLAMAGIALFTKTLLVWLPFVALGLLVVAVALLIWYFKTHRIAAEDFVKIIDGMKKDLQDGFKNIWFGTPAVPEDKGRAGEIERKASQNIADNIRGK